jgi:hypothetical protein
MGLERFPVDVDGQVQPSRKGSGTPDVIDVLMGQDEGIQFARVNPGLFHSPDQLLAAQSRVDQNPGLCGFHITGISTAT